MNNKQEQPIRMSDAMPLAFYDTTDAQIYGLYPAIILQAIEQHEENDRYGFKVSTNDSNFEYSYDDFIDLCLLLGLDDYDIIEKLNNTIQTFLDEGIFSIIREDKTSTYWNRYTPERPELANYIYKFEGKEF